MPRPRKRARLEDGLKLDINKLRRQGLIQPGTYVGPNPVRWWSTYWDEEIARAQISASMTNDYEGWIRIQIGSLDQTIILVPKSRIRDVGTPLGARLGLRSSCCTRAILRRAARESRAADVFEWLMECTSLA